ncbi:unnamed protein product [Staurois parvus]|uniref:Secreted protein n=1 Tax=Staurois parvus TaxID=386267 RepID=A0ABN9EKA3_9NEOB|nr:unnamed protein product [Staurois parvus]
MLQAFRASVFLMRFTAFQYSSVHKKMQPVLLFFLQPERTGTASTDVNYDPDNHITYFLCVLEAEKKQLKRM